MTRRAFGVVLLMAVTAPCGGAETVLFGESSAYQCYLAAQRRGSDAQDVEICTLAIEHQALSAEDLAATYSNRGMLRARLGDLDDALDDYRKAIRIMPEMGSLYVNRANAYARARRLKDAMEDLDRAVAIADDSLAAAHYNRALLFQRLGDTRAARADAERAAKLSPESDAYRRFAADLGQPSPGIAPTQ